MFKQMARRFHNKQNLVIKRRAQQLGDLSGRKKSDRKLKM